MLNFKNIIFPHLKNRADTLNELLKIVEVQNTDREKAQSAAEQIAK